MITGSPDGARTLPEAADGKDTDRARSNHELGTLYSRYREKGRATEIANFAGSFYRPQLLRLPDGWGEAEHRIAFVGREPHGAVGRKTCTEICTLKDFFDRDGSVEELIAAYDSSDDDMYSGPQKNFQRYFVKVVENMRAFGYTVKAIQTNLVKCAVNGQLHRGNSDYSLWPEPYREPYLHWQCDLLAGEFSVIKPTFILFATLLSYIKGEFPGVRPWAIDGFPANRAERLEHPRLPCPAYRAYHPGAHVSDGFAPYTAILKDWSDRLAAA
ncbi:MAG: hypothetical protein ACR2F8_01925 [Caulobacteraceae bacterium]